MTTWLNTPIQMQFRVIDGLSVRFAESEDRHEHALLLSPWPESLLAFEPIWMRLADHAHLVPGLAAASAAGRAAAGASTGRAAT